MRTADLIPPFHLMSVEAQVELVNRVRADRAINKRDVKKAKELSAEFEALSKDDQAQILRAINGATP